MGNFKALTLFSVNINKPEFILSIKNINYKIQNRFYIALFEL